MATMQMQSAFSPSLTSPDENARPMTPKVDSFSRSDLVSRHLLVETALLDSSKFDILAIDEVDALKKEKQEVDLRIESARRKLAMETKVRDAAQSLHRLYAGKGSTKNQKRQSLLSGDRRTSGSSNHSGTASQAEEELSASGKTIDDLLQILNGLENRRQYIESRLLRHTAAVLQAAHAEREAELSQSLQDSGFDDRDYDESIFTNIDSLGEWKVPSSKRSPQAHHQWSDVNLRLQMLNGQLQALISQAKQDQGGDQRPESPDDIPSAYPVDEDDSTDHLSSQLEIMQTTITTLTQEHQRMQDTRHDLHALEARVESANSRLYTMISAESDLQNMYDVQPPPPITGRGTTKQMDYLDETLLTVEQMVQHAGHIQDSHNHLSHEMEGLRLKHDAHSETVSKFESTITGLWDILSSDRTLQKTGDTHEEDDQNAPLAKEPYSLEAFSTRVQYMFQRLSHMDLQTDTLRRQIQQQRELAGKAEANETSARELEDHKRRVEELTSLLDQANAAKGSAEARLSDKAAEMAGLEAEVVRLSTELTMAKAELDGAYGSRGDRAKDVANNPEIQAQLSRLEKLEQDLATSSKDGDRMRTLEKELRDMTIDYQELTRETVEVEKEREQIEAVVDSMRMRIEGLEGQLSDEKLKWLGVQRAGTPEAGAAREQTSTMVMRTEFKKMMREMRVEALKALKNEQEARRKLEAEIRALRRDKSGTLSPNVSRSSKSTSVAGAA